jgi:hypothetical protein
MSGLRILKAGGTLGIAPPGRHLAAQRFGKPKDKAEKPTELGLYLRPRVLSCLSLASAEG